MFMAPPWAPSPERAIRRCAYTLITWVRVGVDLGRRVSPDWPQGRRFRACTDRGWSTICDTGKRGRAREGGARPARREQPRARGAGGGGGAHDERRDRGPP